MGLLLKLVLFPFYIVFWSFKAMRWLAEVILVFFLTLLFGQPRRKRIL